MDALKNFASGNSSKDTANNGNAAQQSGEQKDYGDKAAGFINKQQGGKFTDKQLESGTDAVRNVYEKVSGNKVDPKYSN